MKAEILRQSLDITRAVYILRGYIAAEQVGVILGIDPMTLNAHLSRWFKGPQKAHNRYIHTAKPKRPPLREAPLEIFNHKDLRLIDDALSEMQGDKARDLRDRIYDFMWGTSDEVDPDDGLP